MDKENKKTKKPCDYIFLSNIGIGVYTFTPLHTMATSK